LAIHYYGDVNQCLDNCREAIFARAEGPDNEESEIRKECAYNNLEEAIEDELRALMLTSINGWLKGELPF